MIFFAHSVEQLNEIKARLNAVAFFYYVEGDKVHQYDHKLNRAWRKTDLSQFRDKVKHYPMVYTPMGNGQLQMFLRVKPERIREIIK